MSLTRKKEPYEEINKNQRRYCDKVTDRQMVKGVMPGS